MKSGSRIRCRSDGGRPPDRGFLAHPFAGSVVHQHVAEKNQTLILRVVLGKKIAVVTTNMLGPPR